MSNPRNYKYVDGGNTWFIDATNSNLANAINPATIASCKSLGYENIDFGFINPTSSDFSKEFTNITSSSFSSLAAEISAIHSAGMTVSISFGGDAGTVLGNIAAWTFSNPVLSANDLVDAISQLGLTKGDNIDFDYEIDDGNLSPTLKESWQENLKTFFTTIANNLSRLGITTTATIMGSPGHYLTPDSSYGSLDLVFKNFANIFTGGLRVMMYSDGQHQCLLNNTGNPNSVANPQSSYLNQWLNVFTTYNIPNTALHIGFTNFNGANPIEAYLGAKLVDNGTHAADSYLWLLKQLGLTASSLGSTYWFVNESYSGNLIQNALTEMQQFITELQTQSNLASYDPTELSYPLQPPAPPAPQAPLGIYTFATIPTADQTTVSINYKVPIAVLDTLNPTPTPSSNMVIPGYAVQSGDTLYNIAKIFNAKDPNSMVNILIDNNQQNIGPLSVGEVINLPTPPGGTYTVQSGDTLFNIAQKNNIAHWESVIAANIGTPLFPFSPNQTVLCLPNPLLRAYVVQSGDSMYKIAQSFGTTVNTLQQMNNLQTSDIIVGQTLAVPPLSNVFPYTVQPGDYLYKIANQYGIKDEKNFITINDLNPTNPSFSPGQILLLPLPSTVTGYVVQSGDSFSSIATTYNISVNQLQQWNTWVNPQTLAPGDVLIVGEGS
ncbi:MAG: LysM peptidoglycan-binding domain-containing protein [Chlamydiae bacterium]|nr:LysM peptidoglycan-binding domain-containing protein [Chlamydiota bacterium]